MLHIDLLVSSFAQSCPTLWDPMDYSPPGFQPITNSCSLLKLMSIKSVIPYNHLIHYRPLLLLSQSFPDQGHFQWVTSSHQVAKVLEFQLQHQSFQWIFRLSSFRIDWFDFHAVQGTLKNLLQYHRSKASILWCSAFYVVQLSHPHMTTGKTIALTRWTFVGKLMSQLFNMLIFNTCFLEFLSYIHW